MVERHTQAIMDRLDGLMGNKSNSRNRGAHSGEANREPKVYFNDRQNRGRTHGSTRGRSNSSSNATEDNRPGGPTNTRGSSTGNKPISSERSISMREANATGRGDFTSWNHSNQVRSQPSDSVKRGTDDNDQVGHSRDAAAMATASKPLNKSLGTFLSRLSRTSESSEKSRRLKNQDAIRTNRTTV